MTRSDAYSRNAASFRRGNPRIPPSGKAFLIVTEGEKTEPNYLKKLRDRLQLSMADVVIVHPEGTDPLTLTRRAIELRDAREREAKKDLKKIPYDEVWVVFDLEKPHDERRKLADEARKLKGVKKIKFADSDPCFEYWLLLHEEYTTAPFTDCDEVTRRLRRSWSEYAKGHTPSSEFLEKIPTAVVRAERCREHHKTSNGDGNPSTLMDILIRSLNAATRPHFRFCLNEIG
jgi:hypothetical protein